MVNGGEGLSFDHFGEGVETLARTVESRIVKVRWDWGNFKTTEGYPVDESMINWVIGQDQALNEGFLCLNEWVHKLKHLEQTEWYASWSKADQPKPSAKSVISPGPYLLLLGDPGTGKSLLGRALSEKLTQVYKDNGIKLFDVLSWKNPVLPSQPRVSIHEIGEGKKVLQTEQRKELKRKFATKVGLKAIQALMLTLGVFLLALGLYFMFNAWQSWSTGGVSIGGTSWQELYSNNFSAYFVDRFINLVPLTFIPGGSLIFFSVFIWWFSRMGGLANLRGTGGAQQSDVPKLIVDNGSGSAPFVDATGHRSAQLFGSVAWDPFQTGGLGTPEHQRVTAGDVHIASLGILYIDEIKNLDAEDAITLLTV